MNQILAEEDVVLAFWLREERINSGQSTARSKRLEGLVRFRLTRAAALIINT